MKINICLTIEEETIKKIKKIAEKEKRSLSYKVNQILEKYLEEKK